MNSSELKARLLAASAQISAVRNLIAACVYSNGAPKAQYHLKLAESYLAGAVTSVVNPEKEEAVDVLLTVCEEETSRAKAIAISTKQEQANSLAKSRSKTAKAGHMNF